MNYSQSGQLPHHRYVLVESSFVSKTPGQWLRACWFGLVSIPSRAWGCTVMLECGAVYRCLPPHALAFSEDAEAEWGIRDAQRWDCYGSDFSTLEYTYLRGLQVEAKVGARQEAIIGEYLFTAAPIGDGFSRYPEQAKEFMFIALDNGRLTIQPTDKVLFHETSFATPRWPTDLKRLDAIWSCEP
jgi:hypothetical protein